jgi:excisionase family DNA binding protein
MQPNVTTVSEAAEKKNCGRNTIYRAVERGELNTAEVGKQRMILLDEHFEAFTPKNVGARAARQTSGSGE